MARGVNQLDRCRPACGLPPPINQRQLATRHNRRRRSKPECCMAIGWYWSVHINKPPSAYPWIIGDSIDQFHCKQQVLEIDVVHYKSEAWYRFCFPITQGNSRWDVSETAFIPEAYQDLLTPWLTAYACLLAHKVSLPGSLCGLKACFGHAVLKYRSDEQTYVYAYSAQLDRLKICPYATYARPSRKCFGHRKAYAERGTHCCAKTPSN